MAGRDLEVGTPLDRPGLSCVGSRDEGAETSLEGFIADLRATLARFAGQRLDRQREALIRGLLGSAFGRAYRAGILPEDAQLVISRTPDGLRLKILSGSGLITTAFLSDMQSELPFSQS